MTGSDEADVDDLTLPARELLDIPFCPLTPTGTQGEFLLDFEREALYGGAVGGGKSVALLMGALQYVDTPGYSALVIRRQLTHQSLPGGLLDLAHQWLSGRARWDSDTATWTFPTGATLTFGYLESDRSRDRYQGMQWQYIAFDELTQFPEHHYRYLFSRLRRPSQAPGGLERVPLRMRAASNPGGEGHDWVKHRFITNDGADPRRRFYPARLDDNPHLDPHSYRETLMCLDSHNRAQLLHGDWDSTPNGRLFRREWFTTVAATDVPGDVRRVRFWDLAATPATPTTDPDWTVGCLVALDRSRRDYHVENIVRFRGTPAEVEARVARIAEADGRAVTILIEEGPAAGKALVDHYKRNVVDGYTVHSVRPTDPKTVRAAPVASAAETGRVRIVAGGWNDAFLDEIVMFPDGAHDDQVDALTGAYGWLASKAPSDVELAAGLSLELFTRPSPHRVT
ncbi:MAG: phage terminase large subunit [Acidimicrobiales bacterium]